VAPALDAPIVDLQMAAGLPTLGAHAPAPPEAHGHDHAPAGERDVGHAGAGQAQQPLGSRGDAHVVLLASR
jgi:hypothetical protein